MEDNEPVEDRTQVFGTVWRIAGNRERPILRVRDLCKQGDTVGLPAAAEEEAAFREGFLEKEAKLASSQR